MRPYPSSFFIHLSNMYCTPTGDGAHLFCFRLTFCIHPDIIKITSEYSWYTGARPIVVGEKGSRVRIPHKAVAVLAECLSAMSLGCLFREDGEVRLNV